MKKKQKISEPQIGPPVTRAEWLQTVIKLTNIAINDPSVGDGSGMKEQVARYTKELKGLKK